MKREKISPELRDRVLRRDEYRCRYCGSSAGPFHLDHVYPVSKGGETSIDNMVTSCKRCNLKKHNKVGVWPNPRSLKQERPDELIASMSFLLIGFGVLITPFVSKLIPEHQARNIVFGGGFLLSVGIFIFIKWMNSRKV